MQNVTEDLICKTNVTFWSKLWHKDLIHRFEQQFPVGLWYEDNYFYFTLAPFARKIAFLPEEKINYLQRSGSITAYKEHPKILDKIRIADAILNFYQKHPLPPNLKRTELIAFEDCLFSGLDSTISEAYRTKLLKMAQTVAKNSGLIKQYPQRFRFLKKTPWYLTPFIKHTIKKSYYGLPGFPLIKINRRDNLETIRILGIKIKTRAL